MADALFSSTKKFKRLAQLGKWTSALIHTGTAKRVFGTKPIWAQLKVTERCNLNCGYCTEHKNDGNNVPFETVSRWIKHCSKLGVKHVEFIGGEPLMHPDLFKMLDLARQLKINTGLTTNGFLMSSSCAEQLIEHGIVRLQLSIDCVEPNSITKKAYNSLSNQLAFLRQTDIWVHVNSVITPETIDQAYKLADLLFNVNIPVAFSPAHDCGKLVIPSSNDSIIKFFDWLIVKKNNGSPVNMPQFLINYYIDKMNGKDVSWTCEGGCKAFYVDTNGFFKPCSHQKSNKKFEDVESSTLKYNHGRKKGCENQCGVSCMILNSFPFNRLDYVIKSDLLPFLR